MHEHDQGRRSARSGGREPQDGNRHWIEQTVIHYPTEKQYAQTFVANLSTEALACAFGIDDEAVRTVDALVANAARQ